MFIDKLLKSLSKQSLKAAQLLQNKVRELEEVEKGMFIAFVDDGANSFDVNIKFTPDGKDLQSHQCDCEITESWCAHKIAVLLQLKSGGNHIEKSTIVKKIRKKKLSEAEELLDELDPLKLKSWLIEEMLVNKEMELKFLTSFKKQNTRLTSEELRAFGETTLKAILGRKKRVEPSQLVGIFDIWNKKLELHQPYVISNLANPEIIDLFREVLHFHSDLNYKLTKSTSRVMTNLRKYFEIIEANILLLSAEKKAMYLLNLFTQSRGDDSFLRLIIVELTLLGPEIESSQLLKLLKLLFSSHLKKYDVSESEMLSILQLIKNQNLYLELFDVLPNLRYYNAYNEMLLDLMIEYNQFDRAIEACTKAINSNIHVQYNELYFKKLIEIYELQGDVNTSLMYKEKLFKLAPSYEIYLEIYNAHINEKNKLRFQAEALSVPIRSMSSDYHKMLKLKFGIWSDLGLFDKIIAKIEDKESYAAAKLYMDTLLKYNKSKLLMAIVKKVFDTWNSPNFEEEAEFLEGLFMENYEADDLKKVGIVNRAWGPMPRLIEKIIKIKETKY